MILEDTVTIGASLESVWGLLIDIPRVSTCIPGIENTEEIGPGSYRGVLKVRVGPVAAAFSGRASILETVPLQKMTAKIEGNDKSSESSVGATFTARFQPSVTGTEIHYTVDVLLRGRLAQFGAAVFQGTAKKIAAQFANRVQKALETGPSPIQ